jgi:hypothetical protein
MFLDAVGHYRSLQARAFDGPIGPFFILINPIWSQMIRRKSRSPPDQHPQPSKVASWSAYPSL